MSASNVELFRETIRMSILFVEDYTPFREEMSLALEELFGTVLSASSAEEALILYQNYMEENGRSIDIVLTDIKMPCMDGVAFSQKIKAFNPQQSIVIVSAYTEPEEMIDLINLGIKGFLTKPIEYEKMCDIFLKIADESFIQSSVPEKNLGGIKLAYGFQWDCASKKLISTNGEIYCTKYESMLIDFMIHTKGHICSIDTIIENFYAKGVELTPKSIRNLVMKIRQKTYKDLIRNLYGLGYGLSINE